MEKRILIADDSSVARLVVKRCAEVVGLDGEFEEAEDGQSALLKAAGADIIFIDLNMPKMHGRDVLRALRGSGNQVPIIVVSSAVNQSVSDDLLSLGATAVLRKPFSPASMSEVMERLEMSP
ncbi:MAG: response regulator [Myxococcota bacterium]